MSTNVVDVKDFIDKRPLSAYQWLVVGLCFVVAMLDGIDSAAMGFIAPSLLADWKLPRVAFGAILSASMFGFAIGAMVVGPFADRFGRRKILIGSVLAFGLFNALCALARSPTELAALRLVTGIGLGAAMPTAATLLSEYVPMRLRAFLITVMFAGFAMGSGLAGFIASILLADYGWQGVLLFSGALPVASVPVLLWLLPESARFLTVLERPSSEIALLLNRVCKGGFTGSEAFTSPEPVIAHKAKVPVQLLFEGGRAFGTVMLWLSCFMGLLILYLITGWLPTLITDAGSTVQQAASISARFQVGSIPGALLVGFLMDRFSGNRIVAIAYVLGGVAILSLGANILNAGWLPVQVGVAGFFIGGAQTGLNAIAPSFYPTQVRATGVSWMNGIGRGGGILGSLIGGLLLSLGWQFGAVFAALAIPALIAATGVILHGLSTRAESGNATLPSHGAAERSK